MEILSDPTPDMLAMPRFDDGAIDMQELLRRLAEQVVNAVMDAEADQLCGGGANSRNGYRERSLATCVGTLTLRIPKLRSGSFFPVKSNRNDPEGEFLVRSEGRQYEVFEDMEENNMSLEDYLGVGCDEAWADRMWERTTAPGTRDEFLCFLSDGNADASTTASAKCSVCPAWCF